MNCEFETVIHLGGDWDETQVVVEVEYDEFLEAVESRVKIPCLHEGCKVHRIDITPIIEDHQWKDIESRAYYEIRNHQRGLHDHKGIFA